MSIFAKYQERYEEHKPEEYSLQEYLELCRDDKMAYATANERMLAAIGNPEIIDTRTDEKMSRIFQNRKIRIYPAFNEFYGMEDIIDQIVSYFKHAAQGLEESKQILYLLGPVGGGKSSLAEKLKWLMQKFPIFTFSAHNERRKAWELSPILESPLGFFDPVEDGEEMETEYNIPRRYLRGVMSPWAVKRLAEVNGDITKFKIVKVWPSIQNLRAITKVEPGDESNQDISSLVGKVNIRLLEEYDQKDCDAYSWDGGLCLSNQGLMEFVEMFKAPIKILHPLLTATQEGNYNGTENFGAIPFNGIVLAHCFSEDTELLTNDGWKGVDEINKGDIVATLSTDTNLIEYQPALQKFVYDNVNEMYHMSSSAADHLVTANHKMLYESYNTWKDCLAEDFFVKGAKIPVSGIYKRDDWNFYENDDELRFHIWCVTDGSIHYIKKSDGKINYRFHFKKERKIVRLLNIINSLGYEHSTTQTEDGRTYIYVKSVDPKFTKQLSESHRLLSIRQFDILLEEWVESDGTKLSHLTETGFQLNTNNRFHKDLIQELATISGHKSTAAVTNKDNYDPVYILSIRKNVQKVRCDTINKGTVDYNGKVWCLETKNHTLIARRNGKIIITKNSNESEWDSFKNNRNNEAFLDRVYIVKVPYVLRFSEEEKIYRKLLSNSDLIDAPCAPDTLRMMSQFAVLTRLKEPENSNFFSKMMVYDGESMKDKDTKAKSYQEYRDFAGVEEGMNGWSTRQSYKILSKVFNYDSEEIAANPVHLMFILEKQIQQEQFPPEQEEAWITFIKGILAPKYAEFIGEEIQKAYLESYSEYGQNIFDRYIHLADIWIQDKEWRDPDTGESFDLEGLDEELKKTEKPAGISNAKDFRNEVVNYVLRQRANNEGRNPKWTSYEKLRTVIEKKMFANTEDLLPVITFGKKSSKEEEQKHTDFVERMMERGYTRKQVRLLVEWHQRYSKHN